MFSWTVLTTHGMRRPSNRVLKLVERYYRAESTTVINSISADETRPKVASAKQDDRVRVKSLAEMPGPGGLCALPYIGSMFLFYPFTNFIPEKSHFMFEELHRKYGPIVKFRKGSRWSVLLFDPDLIEEAMSHEGQYPVRPSPPLMDAYTIRTGKKKGLSQVHGEEWVRMRRPVQEFVLQPANLSPYTPVLDEVASELAARIAQSREAEDRVRLESLMLPYAIESAAVYCINARLGFLHDGAATCVQNTSSDSDSQNFQRHQQQHHHHHSHHHHLPHPSLRPQDTAATTTCPFAALSSNSLKSTSLESSSSSSSSISSSPAPFRQLTESERSKLMECIKVYMRSVGNGYYTFPFYKLFRTKLYNEFEEAANYLAAIIQSRLTELVKSYNESSPKSSEEVGRPNLLKSLLFDGRLDVRVCTSMLSGFFSTASDNISNSLGIALWYLAKNPSKQSKLREEIDQCVQLRQRVTLHTLSHMPYLKACLKESHRLTFPSPFGSLRVMPEDIVLKGYHIPAGTSVNFGHNVLGHSAEYFENPEEYKPERWLYSNVLRSNNALKRQQAIITLPFGFGKRNCLGRRLAEQQIYLALIRIVQNFELRLGNPDEKLDVVYKITASSARSMDIRFHPLREKI